MSTRSDDDRIRAIVQEEMRQGASTVIVNEIRNPNSGIARALRAASLGGGTRAPEAGPESHHGPQDVCSADRRHLHRCAKCRRAWVGGITNIAGLCESCFTEKPSNAETKEANEGRRKDLAILEYLVAEELHELAGAASMCWDPRPSSAVFQAEEASAAAERAASRIARFLFLHDPSSARDARLGRELVAILENEAGRTGESEGAVEVLQRILRERDAAQQALARLRAREH